MNRAVKKLLSGILLAGVVFMPALRTQGEDAAVLRKKQVLVRPGDTVWAIACEHALAGDDVRMVVEQIYTANKLSYNIAIQPGQTIIVPVRGADNEKARLAANYRERKKIKYSADNVSQANQSVHRL